MKFSVSSTDLLKRLQVVNGAIASNPVLPILEDFLFEIKDSALTISGSDLETSITTSLEVSDASEDFAIAIPAKILLDTLKGLPEQPISFNIDEKTFGIEITSAVGKYKLVGENGTDFPRIPVPDDVEVVTMEGVTLLEAISNTLFATSTDELRPAMNGVYVQLGVNMITFVATDAHKLVKASYSNVKSEINNSFILPKKALNLLKSTVAAATDVKVSFNNTNAFFSFDSVQMACRLIDSKYPDYNTVIPVDNPFKLAINRVDLLGSLKRVIIFSNKTTNQVILNLVDNGLTISSQDLDFSNEATEQLSCSYDGDPMAIGFNAKFLIEMLSVLGSKEVTFELSTPSRAGILVPSEGNDNEDVLMLVMPVMLSN